MTYETWKFINNSALLGENKHPFFFISSSSGITALTWTWEDKRTFRPCCTQVRSLLGLLKTCGVSWSHPGPGLPSPFKDSVITGWKPPGSWGPCFQWWEISSYPTCQEIKCSGVGRSRRIHGTSLSAEEVVGLDLKYSWTCNFKNMWAVEQWCLFWISVKNINHLHHKSLTSNPSSLGLLNFQICFPKSQWISKENLSNFSSAFNSKNIFRLWILPKVVEDGTLH